MGNGFAFALKQDGSMWAWGENSQIQLGDGTLNRTNRSEQIVTNSVTAIAAAMQEVEGAVRLHDRECEDAVGFGIGVGRTVRQCGHRDVDRLRRVQHARRLPRCRPYARRRPGISYLPRNHSGSLA